MSDVLDRERFDAVVGMLQTQKDPGTIRSIRNDLLAHDAALRARIEDLEGLIRGVNFHAHGLHAGDEADCDHPYCRARRALESDHGEQSE